jgi:hypothetical protein
MMSAPYGNPYAGPMSYGPMPGGPMSDPYGPPMGYAPMGDPMSFGSPYGNGCAGCENGYGPCLGPAMGCMDPSCQKGGPCDLHQHHGPRFFGRAEYLLWFTDRRFIGPPLVTTSDAGTSAADAGVIGLPTTTVLFGNDFVDDAPRQGGRLLLGMWLGHGDKLGVMVRGYGLEDEQTEFYADSSQFPILARPFFDAEIQQQGALLVSFPGLVAGSVAAESTNSLLGGEVLLRQCIGRGYCHRVDFVGGYQYNQIDDSLQIDHNLVSLDSAFINPVGTTIASRDLFEVDNDFHAGVAGLQFQVRKGCWVIESIGKVAIGNMRQTVSIAGNTVTTTPPPGSTTTVRNSGLLAQNSNIGEYKQNEFCVAPELDINLKCYVHTNLLLGVGYSAMYWDEVALSGDQVDFSVNPSQQTGPLIGQNAPVLNEIDSDTFWAQGLNCFVEWWY